MPEEGTARMKAIGLNAAHIAQLEEELERLKKGENTGARLIGAVERILIKIIVGATMIGVSYYGVSTNRELQEVKVEKEVAEQGEARALSAQGDIITQAMEEGCTFEE